MIQKFLLSVFLSFCLVGLSHAFEVEVTDHPEHHKMKGYGKKYGDRCQVVYFAQQDDRFFLRGYGDCRHVTKEKAMNDVSNDRSLLTTEIPKPKPLVDVPSEYWDYMDGYRYDYGGGCVVGWHVRSASFLIDGECQGISDEKLVSDAIKSIKHAKANSSAKNFYYYYEEQSPQGKQRKQEEEDRTRGMILAYGEGQEIALETCAARVNKKKITLKEIQRNHKHISPQYARIIYDRTNNAFDRRGWGLDCFNYSDGIIKNYLMRGIDLRSPP